MFCLYFLERIDYRSSHWPELMFLNPGFGDNIAQSEILKPYYCPETPNEVCSAQQKGSRKQSLH